MLNICTILKLKFGSNKLKKKIGDDKLVVSLVLIAVGVVLCFLYKTQIVASITAATGALDNKITEMFGDAGSTTGGIIFLNIR